MGYATDPEGQVNGQPGDSWVENAVQTAADLIGSLFGAQAEERDRRRMAQNEAAFRAAAAGGTADRAFLRARTGLYGLVNIPVHLPYAVSPSSGDPETPGDLGGWATGPARRHAEALFEALDSWGGPPGSVPEVDPSVVDDLYNLAKERGREVAEAALQSLSAALYGVLPEEYRQAVERGVADHYAGDPRVQAGGVGVLLATGLALALLRRKR